MSTDTTEFTEIPIHEWDRLGEAFESFCRGHLDVSETEITCRSGGASVTVTSRGHVEARMPLHEVSIDRIEWVGVDEAGGSLLFETESVRYQFEQP